MAIENPVMWAVLVVLAATVFGLGLVLLRRRTPVVSPPDPTLGLLQQQVSRLAEQINQLGAQIPRDVGTSLSQLTGQMAARLSENAQALQKASADTGKLIADINLRLGELRQSSQEILALGQDVRGLQQIFQAPKIRGGLGEMSLGSLLQQVFPAGHFALQHAFRDGLIVDAVLRLPGGLVPIDSKFPLAGFRLILEAPAAERERARRAFGRDVRRHIDDIAGKYIRPSEGTLDFALMYVPAENVFYELIARDEADAEGDDLSAYAQKRRVLPVSPNSIYAYLQAIAYGLMGLRIEERAREILKGLQQLGGDFGTFKAAFDLGLRHFKNAQNAFSEAGDRADRLGDKIQQYARVAQEPPGDEAVAPPAVQSEERVHARQADR
ncbi:MAG TPA: DNA recombination protein RmuC [Candidatus Polarisedimenticolia bacterium]|jgi:DNA recombination protein RmuC|nr:DNA recombination protein RmuC [Candidatus Polarisedimenticolia bacterium]